MRHSQKGSAVPWIIVAAVILALLLLYFLHTRTASAPTGQSDQTNGFSPLDSSGNPFVTGTAPHQTVDNSFPTTTVAAEAPPTTYVPPPVENPPQTQNYQVQTSAPTPIAVTPFVTQVVTGTSPSYAPYTPQSQSADYTYNLPITPSIAQTRATSTTNQGSSGSNGTGQSLDQTIFGYVSGLGWTQLLGSTGQQIYDTLYGLTPQGLTGQTLGQIVDIPGASTVFGSGGPGTSGGGIGGGGGGGGAAGNFGGQISQITYCTCSDSMLLGIKDVRGQTVNLFYQYGVSQLYANYDIFKNGVDVLGNYKSGGGSCMVYVGEGCSSEGSGQGTITMIGTGK